MILKKERKNESQKAVREKRPEQPKEKTPKEPLRNKKRASGKAVYILMALGFLMGTVLCCYGGSLLVKGSLNRFSEDIMMQMTQQNQMEAEAAIAAVEKMITNWANMIRSGQHTSRDRILESVEQGAKILDCQRLFLMDEDGYFYASTGRTELIPIYQSYLQQTEENTRIFCHKNENNEDLLLVCARVRPFTSEQVTFVGVLAEFMPQTVFAAMSEQSGEEKTAACILDHEGRTIAQYGSESVLRRLDSAKIPGYSSPVLLKRDILDGNELRLNCTLEGKKYLLLSKKMEGREWVYTALCPMDDMFPQAGRVTAGFLIISVLVFVGAVFVFVLFVRLGVQRRRADRAQLETQKQNAQLEKLQQANQKQQAFLEQISHDIRIPLNSVIGFSSLAAHHVQEPEQVMRYLDKVVESARQLLGHLERGLGHGDAIVEPATLNATVEKPVTLEGRRILVVEDNALNREIASEILMEAGMLVECAEDGQQAFQHIMIAKPGYYDLVLMDLQMPVMDGCEATRVIRRMRNKYLAEIPILAMTASTSDADQKKAKEAGMNGYIKKPIDIQTLLWAIQNALRLSREKE